MIRLFVRAQAVLASRRNDSGVTAVEYALLVALIGAVIVGSVGLLGMRINRLVVRLVTVVRALHP